MSEPMPSQASCSENLGPMLLAVSYVLLCTAITAVALRLYVKLGLRNGIRSDDYTIVASLVSPDSTKSAFGASLTSSRSLASLALAARPSSFSPAWEDTYIAYLANRSPWCSNGRSYRRYSIMSALASPRYPCVSVSYGSLVGRGNTLQRSSGWSSLFVLPVTSHRSCSFFCNADPWPPSGTLVSTVNAFLLTSPT